jgi:glycine dehydrogenase subunit 1
MTYIQNTARDREAMLKAIGVPDVDALFADIPASVRLKKPLKVPPFLSEMDLQRHLFELSARNVTTSDKPSFLGAGYYDHLVPAVVDHVSMRSEFYTAYTPYQPEASQGTLQWTFEYQTMISELTGLPVANASLYDGASALAEAVMMARGQTGRSGVLVSRGVHPEYRQTVATYLKQQGGGMTEIPCPGATEIPKPGSQTAAVVVQHPNFFGVVEDLEAMAKSAHAAGALFIVSANPVALGLLKRPGDCGADIVCGEGQPLGCYPWYGGPGFGFLSTKMEFMRRIPGRIVGQTTDRTGRRAYVLTLQTREQHIRREKATSNVCTNQALMALRGTIFLTALGPKGLKQMATLCLQKARYAAERIARIPGWSLPYAGQPGFHEFVAKGPTPASEVNAALLKKGFLGGYDLSRAYPELQDCLLFCVTEKRTRDEIDGLVKALTAQGGGGAS